MPQIQTGGAHEIGTQRRISRQRKTLVPAIVDMRNPHRTTLGEAKLVPSKLAFVLARRIEKEIIRVERVVAD